MKEPNTRNQINQHDPVWIDQKLSNQHVTEPNVDGVPGECEDASRDEFVRVIGVDAYTKTVLEWDQSKHKQGNA